MFVIAAEGSVTEEEYFNLFNGDQTVVKVKCLKGTKRSSPAQVLKKLTRFLREQSLSDLDEAWVVVDKDEWADAELYALQSWSKKKENYGLAVSNPKFEFWLILHFFSAGGITTSRHCDDKLKKKFPGYNKHIERRQFTAANIKSAITKAKALDQPRCKDWPKGPGTTVYRLVERIISASAVSSETVGRT
jgi:hypothetical protein